jgi:nitrogen fixation protein FixH
MKQAAMTPSSAAQPNRRALWIPGIFVLGFLIVIAVNGILIVTAVRSFSGLETDSSYDKGLKYNQALAGAAANARTGWHAEPHVTAARGMDRRLEITVTDRDGQPVTGLTMGAYLVRPTNAGMDTALTLTELGAGRYGAAFTPEALGNWDLRLKARRGDIDWQQAQRIFLQ